MGRSEDAFSSTWVVGQSEDVVEDHRIGSTNEPGGEMYQMRARGMTVRLLVALSTQTFALILHPWVAGAQQLEAIPVCRVLANPRHYNFGTVRISGELLSGHHGLDLADQPLFGTSEGAGQNDQCNLHHLFRAVERSACTVHNRSNSPGSGSVCGPDAPRQGDRLSK
jgi:hypothetical protein